MRNYSKILITIIITTLFVISSCKKDVMIIEGCTESTAMNYMSNATSNDGSCIFAYDIAQGIWYFDSECPNAPFPGIEDMLPSNVNVESAGNNSLSLIIESPIGEPVTVLGTIDNDGNINVAEQALFSIDTLGVQVPILVSGDGQITSQASGLLDLNYSATFAIVELFDFSCIVTLFREE